MIEELRKRFLSQFIEIARVRLGKIQAAVAERCGPRTVQFELHALAGEASALGFAELSESIRQAEADARRWLDPGDGENSQSFNQVLAGIEREIEVLATQSSEF